VVCWWFSHSSLLIGLRKFSLKHCIHTHQKLKVGVHFFVSFANKFSGLQASTFWTKTYIGDDVFSPANTTDHPLPHTGEQVRTGASGPASSGSASLCQTGNGSGAGQWHVLMCYVTTGPDERAINITWPATPAAEDGHARHSLSERGRS